MKKQERFIAPQHNIMLLPKTREGLQMASGAIS